MIKNRPFVDPRQIRNVLVSTPDDWYPTLEGRHVKVSLLILRDECWRVCLWGGDDTGMERDFDTYDEAKPIFDLIVGVGNISKQDLVGLGFYAA